MAGIDINGDGKTDFSLTFGNVVSIVVFLSTIFGSYYTLNSKVEKAMASPKVEVTQKDLDALRKEYDLKIEKVAVQAAENMDEIKDFEREVRNNYKRNR